MLKFQNYVRAKSLEEAWELNQNKRNRVLGGMMWLKMSNSTIGTAIDLCELGLDKIEETEEEFSIGAMATLRDIELHKNLNCYTQGAVREAVKILWVCSSATQQQWVAAFSDVSGFLMYLRFFLLWTAMWNCTKAA